MRQNQRINPRWLLKDIQRWPRNKGNNLRCKNRIYQEHKMRIILFFNTSRCPTTIQDGRQQFNMAGNNSRWPPKCHDGKQQINIAAKYTKWHPTIDDDHQQRQMAANK